VDQELKAYLDGKFAAVESKLAAVDSKLAAVDSKLAAVESKFAAVESKLAAVDSKFAEIRAEMVLMEDRLVEQMRDMQTELLRGFESFSVAQTLRLRKVEADQSNLDTSLRGRMDIMEARLLQIEFRQGKTGPAN